MFKLIIGHGVEIAGVESLIFLLQVVATDGGSPALSSDTLVTVVVLDVNDNPPQFNSSSLNLTIPENEPLSSIIGDFIVVDNDQGLAASLVFVVLGDEADRYVSMLVINQEREI